MNKLFERMRRRSQIFEDLPELFSILGELGKVLIVFGSFGERETLHHQYKQ